MKKFFERLASANWGVLEVFLSEASPIDLPQLNIQDRQDAQEFLRGYGYNLNNPREAAEVEHLRREALAFIQEVLIDTLEPDWQPLVIPELIQEAGIRELLLLASCAPDALLQRWACAVLRVMHTLAHVSSELSLHFFPSIVEQILNPYYDHIRPDNDRIWLGTEGDFRLPLVDFEVKAGKQRYSALLKLLHKPANVATDLFDRIGLRFVTRDRLDTLLVLHYLREKHLVAFPNVKPGKINSLLDIGRIRKSFRTLAQRYEKQEITLTEFESALRQCSSPQSSSQNRLRRLFKFNPHSSHEYRSIQFTVRQLVRLENPLSNVLRELEQAEGPELWSPQKQELTPYRFFFPYEIQIVDAETHQNNMHGQASHETYKKRQLEAARRRVLGPLLHKRNLTERPEISMSDSQHMTEQQETQIQLAKAESVIDFT